MGRKRSRRLKQQYGSSSLGKGYDKAVRAPLNEISRPKKDKTVTWKQAPS